MPPRGTPQQCENALAALSPRLRNVIVARVLGIPRHTIARCLDVHVYQVDDWRSEATQIIHDHGTRLSPLLEYLHTLPGEEVRELLGELGDLFIFVTNEQFPPSDNDLLAAFQLLRVLPASALPLELCWCTGKPQWHQEGGCRIFTPVSPRQRESWRWDCGGVLPESLDVE